MRQQLFDAVVAQTGTYRNYRSVVVNDHNRLKHQLTDLSREDRLIHAGRIKNSADAMITHLMTGKEGDFGNAEFERWDVYGDDDAPTKTEHKVLILPTSTFLHMVAKVEYPSETPYAVDLFVDRSADMVIDTPVIRGRLLNYNRDNKIAGYWLDKVSKISTDPSVVATAHDAHETAARIFNLIEVPHPEGFYQAHNDVLHEVNSGRQ